MGAQAMESEETVSRDARSCALGNRKKKLQPASRSFSTTASDNLGNYADAKYIKKMK